MNDLFAVILAIALGLPAGVWVSSKFLPDPKPVAEPTPSRGTFKVIDHYKDCDVVQYQYGLLSEYKYFLDCPK
jgi:hypothetical protein